MFRHRFLEFYQPALIGLIFLLLPLWLIYPIGWGPRTLLPVDSLSLFEPFKTHAPISENQVPHNALIADLILQNYPWQKFSVQALRNNEFPLWNPYLFAGTPFLAKGQSATLYPLSIVFYIFPIPQAYGIFILLHLFLSGLWTYWFCRTLKISRFGSLIAGATYELSGFLSANAVFPMIIAGAAWLPLILLAVERRFLSRDTVNPLDKIWIPVGACALAFQLLAGHIEITYYTLLMIGFYTLWKLIGICYQDPVSPKKLFGLVRSFSGMLLLGFSLAAIQLIPLMEVLQDNFRQGGGQSGAGAILGLPLASVNHILDP